MLLLLLYLAFAHRRNAELVGLAAPLCLADAIGVRLTQSVPATALAFGTDIGRKTEGLLLGLALLAAVATTLFAYRNLNRGPDRFTPDAALSAVAAKGIKGQVFNAFNFGDYLAFRGYPPFVDGRVDMYGDAFMQAYAAPAQLSNLLQRYHIAWTLLEPKDVRIVLMDREPGWSRLYSDSVAVVHWRSASAP